MDDRPAGAARLVVVGPGGVGLSLAADLARRGPFRPVTVAGRRPEPPPFLVRAAPEARYVSLAATGVPTREALRGLWEGSRGPPALLFAVPDDALARAAEAWASALAEADLPAPAASLHTSGFHPSTILARLATARDRAASWHPLVALAAPRTGAFAGRTVAVEGGESALAVAEAISGAVGGRPVRIRPDEKARWHAAAALASNGLVACLSVALREAVAASDGAAGLDALLPLARSALEELAEKGAEGGLTGPVARGDAGTVSGHLAALDPDAAALYRLLSAELLRLAGPGLEEASRRAMAASLAATGPAVSETGKGGAADRDG